jgi:hypothetical protein
MTDTTTQTGRDGARVSAAAPCRTPACASYAGGLTQRQARSARVQILIRDGRHADDSLAPLWAKPNDEDPPPRSARGDPRDPPGLGGQALPEHAPHASFHGFPGGDGCSRYAIFTPFLMCNNGLAMCPI